MTRLFVRERTLPPWLATASMLLLVSLAACAPQPARYGGGAPLSEKSILRALDAVRADDDQRARVLGAFETARPKLEELRDQGESLREQVHEISPRSNDYMAR